MWAESSLDNHWNEGDAITYLLHSCEILLKLNQLAVRTSDTNFYCKTLFTLPAVYIIILLHDLQTGFNSINFSADCRLFWSTNYLHKKILLNYYNIILSLELNSIVLNSGLKLKLYRAENIV